MLRGYRFLIAALGGITLLITLGIGAYVGALHAPYQGYDSTEARQSAANSEQRNPHQIDRDRAGLPDTAERIASAPDPKNADEREKRDLAAQEASALWAFWMLVVSSISAVTTIVGTGFLLWQIVLTRKAVEDTGEATDAMRLQNEQARQNAVLQFRPYMGTLGAAVFNPFMKPEIVIDIKNFGQSPARIIFQDFRVVHIARQEVDNQFKRIFYTIPVQPTAHCDPGHTQSRTGIIDGPINLLNGDQVFAELTQTYLSFDGATYWRRMSYQMDRNSTWIEKQKIRMDVYEVAAEAGEGDPPPSYLPKN